MRRSTSNAVECRELVRAFSVGKQVERVVKGANLDIPFGSLTAVLGRSGSGKSTLLNMLGLLLTPTSGTIRINGQRVDNLSSREAARFRLSSVGFIFQQFHLIDHKTVLENVELPLVYLSTGARERKRRAREVLEDLGLGHRLDSFPDTLSGGEKQRVAIARAVVTKPKLLLCDEPTGNLDSQRAADVLQILRQMTGPGQATIIVTHDPVVAAACDSVVTVSDGHVQREDKTHSTAITSVEPESGSIPRFRLGHWFRVGVLEAFRTSIHRFRRNTFTALGVALGVASLVLTVGLAATISAQLSDKFNAFLAQQITVSGPEFLNLPPADAAALAESERLADVLDLNGVSAAGVVQALTDGTPVPVALYESEGAVTNGEEITGGEVQAPVKAISVGALKALGGTIESGRTFDSGHVDRRDPVALVGHGVLERLGKDWQPGMSVFVQNQEFSIIGVIGDEDQSGSNYASILIPVGQSIKPEGSGGSESSLAVRVVQGAASQVGAEVKRAWKPSDPAAVAVAIPPEPTSLREAVDEQQQMLMLAMSAVTLVIGGVGIMNTFLVSILERRREIGLRMALGSSRSGIVVQFGVEAVLVALMGSVIGILLGVNSLTLISVLNSWIPVIDPMMIPVGLAAGALIGFAAGLYPAIKASRIDPVQSLTQS